MTRILLTGSIVGVMCLSLPGCGASPEPLTILLPTYSVHRDGVDTTADADPIHFDPVAAAEQ